MSDTRARDAERGLAATGSVADEARAITERLRAGALRHDEVALQAYLGHAPSQLALGDVVAPVALAAEEDAILWLRGLSAFGGDVLVRALVGWLRAGAGPEAEWPQEVVEVFATVDAWCERPEAATLWRLSRASAFPRLAETASGWCALLAYHLLRNRRDALDLVDRVVRRAPGVTPAQVADALARWPLEAELRDLPPGPGLRARVVDLTTPPARRAVVAALRAHEGRRVVLAFATWPAMDVQVLPGTVETEQVEVLPRGAPARRVRLREVVDVRPAE